MICCCYDECHIYNYLILHSTHVVDVRKGNWSTLLHYSSLTPLERECYGGEVKPYRKTDYKSMIKLNNGHYYDFVDA